MTPNAADTMVPQSPGQKSGSEAETGDDIEDEETIRVLGAVARGLKRRSMSACEADPAASWARSISPPMKKARRLSGTKAGSASSPSVDTKPFGGSMAGDAAVGKEKGAATMAPTTPNTRQPVTASGIVDHTNVFCTPATPATTATSVPLLGYGESQSDAVSTNRRSTLLHSDTIGALSSLEPLKYVSSTAIELALETFTVNTVEWQVLDPSAVHTGPTTLRWQSLRPTTRALLVPVHHPGIADVLDRGSPRATADVGHWTIAKLALDKRTVEIYDPLPGNALRARTWALIKATIDVVLPSPIPDSPTHRHWVLQDADDNIMHQSNEFDCGIYTIVYGIYHLLECTDRLPSKINPLAWRAALSIALLPERSLATFPRPLTVEQEDQPVNASDMLSAIKLIEQGDERLAGCLLECDTRVQEYSAMLTVLHTGANYMAGIVCNGDTLKSEIHYYQSIKDIMERAPPSVNISEELEVYETNIAERRAKLARCTLRTRHLGKKKETFATILGAIADEVEFEGEHGRRIAARRTLTRNAVRDLYEGMVSAKAFKKVYRQVTGCEGAGKRRSNG